MVKDINESDIEAAFGPAEKVREYVLAKATARS
jgi:hypothetical protein